MSAVTPTQWQLVSIRWARHATGYIHPQQQQQSTVCYYSEFLHCRQLVEDDEEENEEQVIDEGALVETCMVVYSLIPMMYIVTWCVSIECRTTPSCELTYSSEQPDIFSDHRRTSTRKSSMNRAFTVPLSCKVFSDKRVCAENRTCVCLATNAGKPLDDWPFQAATYARTLRDESVYQLQCTREDELVYQRQWMCVYVETTHILMQRRTRYTLQLSSTVCNRDTGMYRARGEHRAFSFIGRKRNFMYNIVIYFLAEKALQIHLFRFAWMEGLQLVMAELVTQLKDVTFCSILLHSPKLHKTHEQ